MDFAEARCVAKVPDRVAVLKRAARLTMCIPSTSTPRSGKMVGVSFMMFCNARSDSDDPFIDAIAEVVVDRCSHFRTVNVDDCSIIDGF